MVRKKREWKVEGCVTVRKKRGWKVEGCVTVLRFRESTLPRRRWRTRAYSALWWLRCTSMVTACRSVLDTCS